MSAAASSSSLMWSIVTVTKSSQPLAGTSLFCVLSFLVCMREHRFELIFERSRRYSGAKSRPAVQGRLNLIARERRVRQELSEAGDGTPEGKGHSHEHRPQSRSTRNGPQQLLV